MLYCFRAQKHLGPTLYENLTSRANCCENDFHQTKNQTIKTLYRYTFYIAKEGADEEVGAERAAHITT